MSVISDEILTGRKRHICDCCGGPIAAGEKYRRQVYRDGEFITYKAHLDCDAAVLAYAKIADLLPDEFVPVSEFIAEDSFWLWAEFPSVARRINMPSFSWAHEHHYIKYRFWL